MKTVKRILSLLCAAAITFSMSTTMAFASNSNSQSRESVYTAEELAQIELERQELTEFLKAQLIAQNALHRLDEFMFLVDQTIQRKYYPNAYARVTRYYALDGGWLYGTATNSIIEVDFVNPADTAILYDNRDLPIESLAFLINDLLWIFIHSGADFTDFYSAVLDAATLCQVIANERMWQSVNVGVDGVLFYGAYDTLNMTTTTVFWPWDEYPWIYPSDYHSMTVDAFEYK